jgi:hypothetical protein
MKELVIRARADIDDKVKVELEKDKWLLADSIREKLEEIGINIFEIYLVEKEKT